MIHKLSSKLAFALILSTIGTQAMAAGAIAISDKYASQYGFSHDYPNRREANIEALSQCGSGCKVVLNFDSGCGAYATDQAAGSTVWAWGTSSSGNGAQDRALEECYSRGGTSCQVLAWSCNAR
ncbi:MAG: DUF4189 domain-containing protein [Methylococcales bacterium]